MHTCNFIKNALRTLPLRFSEFSWIPGKLGADSEYRVFRLCAITSICAVIYIFLKMLWVRSLEIWSKTNSKRSRMPNVARWTLPNVARWCLWLDSCDNICLCFSSVECSINPLLPGVAFLYPLKRFSDVFRGYRKATPGCNGLNYC